MDSSIARACELAGGQSSLARQLGVEPPTVNGWVKGARPVPESRCPDIERIVRGGETCEDLRPDLVWTRVSDKAWPWHKRGRPLLDFVRSQESQAAGA